MPRQLPIRKRLPHLKVNEDFHSAFSRSRSVVGKQKYEREEFSIEFIIIRDFNRSNYGQMK